MYYVEQIITQKQGIILLCQLQGFCILAQIKSSQSRRNCIIKITVNAMKRYNKMYLF